MGSEPHSHRHKAQADRTSEEKVISQLYNLFFMITDLRLFPAINSKGETCVKIILTCDSISYSASVPSGTSKGANEAKEMAFEKVRRLFPKVRQKLVGMEEDSQKMDRLLLAIDRTKNFGSIGGNLALAISIAAAKAQSCGDLWKLDGLKESQIFPIPLGNVIGGGAHGGGTDWQEFLLIPHLAKTPLEAIESLVNAWYAIGDELRSRKLLEGRNYENAWMSSLNEEKTLDFLSAIAEDWNMRIGVDFASSSFWNGKSYVYKKSGKKLDTDQQLELVKDFAERYKIWYLEDPFHENGFASFKALTRELGSKHLVGGDDLYCTQLRRLEKGVMEKASNGIIIKPNQVGTLFQAGLVTSLAHKHGIVPVVSHRSGETDDRWLADLGILWNAPLIKTGVMGMERLAKHNRLIQLWEEVPNPRMAEMP
jgi:enolase